MWLCLAFCTLDEVVNTFESDSNVQLISITSSFPEEKLQICNLGQLYQFVKFINETRRSGSMCALCTGTDQEALTVCAFLLGGYLIVEEKVPFEVVSSTFDGLSEHFRAFQDPSSTMSGENLTVHDGWRAISQANANGWLNFQDEEKDPDSCIDMQEYEHYDNPLNGFLHVIIPSQLIAF